LTEVLIFKTEVSSVIRIEIEELKNKVFKIQEPEVYFILNKNRLVTFRGRIRKKRETVKKRKKKI
jgi:NACalpha-BTF3-like transcription factor